jgi:hypothetical protein
MPTALPMDRRVNLDAESRGLIFQGASVNQLAAIFKPVKSDEIMRRLGDLEPVGTGRQGNPIYGLAAAAARIVRPQITPEAIDAYMRTANHSHLPPMVSKHYWEGLRTRERYREEVDELWFTEDIVRLLSEVFQSVRATLVLLPDLMRARGDMAEPQFRFVQRVVDNAVEDLCARLVDGLAKPSRSDAETGTGAWEQAGAL